MNLLRFLYIKTNEPQMFGFYHILMVILLMIFTIYLIKKHGDKKDKVILILSIVLIIFEIFKQIYYCYNIDTNVFDYRWYIFPFQFCSIPMYLGIIAYFVKNKNIKNTMYLYMATFGLLGGLATIIYPEGVFTTSLYINLQTMIHHGFQVVMGVYLIKVSNFEFNKKNIRRVFILFLIIIAIALSIDISTYYLGINSGLKMFFISPFHKCSLPIFSNLYEINYYLFLVSYISAITLGSIGIFKLATVKHKKNTKQD